MPRMNFNNYLRLSLIISFNLILVQSIYAQHLARDGFRREFYESGKLLSETNCLDEYDTGVYREYFENGNVKMEFNYKDGQRDGAYADYCEDGSPRVKFEYKNNKRDGQYKLYYDNGQLQAEGSYQDGKETGIHRMYYPNGKLSAEVNYKDGKEDGLAQVFYDDESLWEEYSYKEGVLDGKYYEYERGGILVKEIDYKNGKFIRGVNYDDDRKVILEVMKDLMIDRKKVSTQETAQSLYKCVSDEVGISFACNPGWRLNRKGKILKVTISEVPDVYFVIEETDQKVKFMSDLSRDALASMGRYENDFNVERINHCDRETVKVNGYLKDSPDTRVSDFYLNDHLKIHSIKFTVKPKEVWENYQWLIKEIVDSLHFEIQKANIKLMTEETNESCSDIVE